MKASTIKTTAEIAYLFHRFLAHCPGTFNLNGPVCPNCPCLGDCLCEGQ